MKYIAIICAAIGSNPYLSGAFLIAPLRSPSLPSRDRFATIARQFPGDRGEEEEPNLPRIEDLPGPEDTTEEKIRSLFVLFNNALATRNPKLVTKRYAKDAVLLPGSSGDALMDAPAIERFYESYLLENPRKRILEGRIRIGHGWAEDAGICEITTARNSNGIKARYSFVYVWESNQWKILHHHTSALGKTEVSQAPSVPSSSGPMTEQRVQNLFQLFQDSFDIGDADLVARRFRNDAIMLPLDVYDSHKDGHDQIREYFEEFMLGQPSITRVERANISIDDSSIKPKWAKDVGTFQLTFQTDGSNLDARYSIDYLLGDGDVWKISQMIISPLPKDWSQLRTKRRLASTESYNGTMPMDGKSSQEPVSSEPPPATEEQVRGWFDEWNAALATRDPEEVALRYARDAVMMTTASGTPKTTPQEIREFYQMFLWNRPQATIVQSFVTISKYWCKDVGVLEYTMKHGKRNIRERYSFLYVHDEESGWKIAHHHFSAVLGDLQETGPEVRDGSGDQFFQ